MIMPNTSFGRVELSWLNMPLQRSHVREAQLRPADVDGADGVTLEEVDLIGALLLVALSLVDLVATISGCCIRLESGNL